MEVASTEVDEQRLEQFMGQAVTDMGAAMNGVLVMIGGELGLWEAMAGAGPLTADEIAERTGRLGALRPRVGVSPGREWLPDIRRGRGDVQLPPEQAMAFADKDSPVYMLGATTWSARSTRTGRSSTERFRTGAGFGWHEHDAELFLGTEQFFRPGLPRPSGRGVDPGARGRRGQAPPGRQGRRHRLRPRDLDDPDGPGISASRPSTGSTTTTRRSSGRARSPRARGSRTTRSSPSRARRTTRARAMTWSASSTACTTWATRSAR